MRCNRSANSERRWHCLTYILTQEAFTSYWDPAWDARASQERPKPAARNSGRKPWKQRAASITHSNVELETDNNQAKLNQTSKSAKH